MLIIETNTSFGKYLKSLSKAEKKNYKYATKQNRDLTYFKTPFSRQLIEKFMRLWEQQVIRGRHRRWKFNINHIENLEKQDQLMVFVAKDKDDIPQSVHFVQLHKNYIEAHPPMYDKSYGYDRYLAKWMWFNLIKYVMDNKLPHIDMGGPIDTSWREMIKRREEFKNSKYKWLYIPEGVKNNPDLQPDYKLADGKLTKKFILRNDDVAFDTDLAEIKKFCEIADKYGYQIIQAIIPIGEAKKIKTSRMTNDQIKATSSRLFSENRSVLEYLLSRNDFIGIHGLWHSHKPTMDEIKTAKTILEGLGFKPTYFIPPFNEGDYPEEVYELKTCNLSIKNGDRLEDFLETGTPNADIMYLHSWRFNSGWYTFEMLDNCLNRLKIDE